MCDKLLDVIADRLLPVTDPVGGPAEQLLEAEALARRLLDHPDTFQQALTMVQRARGETEPLLLKEDETGL